MIRLTKSSMVWLKIRDWLGGLVVGIHIHTAINKQLIDLSTCTKLFRESSLVSNTQHVVRQPYISPPSSTILPPGAARIKLPPYHSDRFKYTCKDILYYNPATWIWHNQQDLCLLTTTSQVRSLALLRFNHLFDLFHAIQSSLRSVHNVPMSAKGVQ